MRINNVKSWSLFLVLFFILSLVPNKIKAAGEDIQVVLVQPAVYSANKGDELNYSLDINLPKDYTKKYKNFTVTVMFDGNLSVLDSKLKEISQVPGKMLLVKSTLEAQKKDIVSFSVNDLNVLKNKTNLSIAIKTKVKNNVKAGENFKNSFVLTFVDKSGKEDSSQKDLISNTFVEKGSIKVEDITEKSKNILGKTEPKLPVKAFVKDKLIGEGRADSTGKFEFTIPVQKAGSEIKVVSYITLKGKTEEIEQKVIVKKESSRLKDDNQKDQPLIINDESVKIELLDYLHAAKNLNATKLSAETQAAVKAAIANGEYISIKSKTTDKEISDTVEMLKSVIKDVRKPYMSGYSKTKFGPNNKIKRSEVAVILKRLLVGDDIVGYFSSFSDVKESAWYSDSIGYIEHIELMQGYKGNLFKPDKDITRAEFASIIVKYANLEDGFSSKSFSDVKSSHWAKDNIDKVSSAGLMVGTTGGKFNPDKAMTRAEVTSVINKLLSRQPDKEFIKKYSKNPFNDIKSNFWAYYDILEATGNWWKKLFN